MVTNMDHDGWVLRESAAPNAEHTVLLLAGALCSAAFFDDLMAEPAVSGASMRLVAVTLPRFAGTNPPDDLSMENYAELASELAADLGCDAVVGHSVGANVAIEMAASSIQRQIWSGCKRSEMDSSATRARRNGWTGGQ